MYWRNTTTCNLQSQTSTGLKTLEFQVDKPFQPLAQYEFMLGDQVILAPMVNNCNHGNSNYGD